MKKVNFIPKTDIDEYLNDDFNKKIFFNLTESEDSKGIFEPLEFLNLLYEQVEIIKANKEKPSAVVNHLLGLELDKTKLCYLLFCLEVRIIKASNTAYEDNETYFKLKNCVDFIKREREKCVDFIKREREKLEAKLHTIPDGFENILEEYLKELDLFQKNEPEKYEAFKGITDSIKNISLSKFIEYIEFLFEKSKRDYSGLTVSIARKEIFIRGQLEIYEKANLRFKKFGDYANDTFNKYQPIFTEALEYWKAELDNLKPVVTALPPQPIDKSPFSVLEWATIFYYADETKLLPKSRFLKTRLEQFMSKHQVDTTFNNFKNMYYEAKRRINEKNDYPINKLELIIPFLKENYKQTVIKVENDIIFLEENKPEY
jgi:hypothetical protein